MNKKARLYLGAALSLISLIAWWLTGFDFNARGLESVFCFFSVISSFLIGVTCPSFD